MLCPTIIPYCNSFSRLLLLVLLLLVRMLLVRVLVSAKEGLNSFRPPTVVVTLPPTTSVTRKAPRARIYANAFQVNETLSAKGEGSAVHPHTPRHCSPLLGGPIALHFPKNGATWWGFLGRGIWSVGIPGVYSEQQPNDNIRHPTG